MSGGAKDTASRLLDAFAEKGFELVTVRGKRATRTFDLETASLFDSRSGQFLAGGAWPDDETFLLGDERMRGTAAVAALPDLGFSWMPITVFPFADGRTDRFERSWRRFKTEFGWITAAAGSATPEEFEFRLRVTGMWKR